MCNQKLAKEFFRLGEQYAETAKLLLDTLINNGNSNAGIGITFEEAYQKMERNASKSDMYLFIPAIFNCLQSTELIIKGLLLLVGENFERNHGVEKLLDVLKGSYKKDSDVFVALKSFYDIQIDIIQKYKQANGLTNTYDLYMSLRYPEITLRLQENEKKGQKIIINYSDLIGNGIIGIEQFKLLLDNMEAVKCAAVREYNSKCS